MFSSACCTRFRSFGNPFRYAGHTCRASSLHIFTPVGLHPQPNKLFPLVCLSLGPCSKFGKIPLQDFLAQEYHKIFVSGLKACQHSWVLKPTSAARFMEATELSGAAGKSLQLRGAKAAKAALLCLCCEAATLDELVAGFQTRFLASIGYFYVKPRRYESLTRHPQTVYTLSV